MYVSTFRRGRIRGMGGLGAALSPIQTSIVAAATSAGLDPALALAVANQESGFNPAARSSKGAVGLFQLMPATAADLGVDPSNTDQNIAGGVRYLKQMLTRCGGDVDCALWSYNAGPGNQSAGIKPAETQKYIPLVEGYYSTWQNELGGPSPSPSVGSSLSDWLDSIASAAGSDVAAVLPSFEDGGIAGNPVNVTAVVAGAVLLGLGLWALS